MRHYQCSADTPVCESSAVRPSISVPSRSAKRPTNVALDRHIVFIIHQQRNDRAKSLDLLANPDDFKFFLADNLVDIPHGRPPKGWLGWQRAYKKRVPEARQKRTQKSGPIPGATIQRGRKAGSQGRLCKMSF